MIHLDGSLEERLLEVEHKTGLGSAVSLYLLCDRKESAIWIVEKMLLDKVTGISEVGAVVEFAYLKDLSKLIAYLGILSTEGFTEGLPIISEKDWLFLCYLPLDALKILSAPMARLLDSSAYLHLLGLPIPTESLEDLYDYLDSYWHYVLNLFTDQQGQYCCLAKEFELPEEIIKEAEQLNDEPIIRRTEKENSGNILSKKERFESVQKINLFHRKVAEYVYHHFTEFEYFKTRTTTRTER